MEIERTAKQVWTEALPDELRFWDYFLSTDDSEVVQQRVDRLDALNRPLQEIFARGVEDFGRQKVRVLDVGAGPLTTLGAVVEGHLRAEIVPIDPLAQGYSRLLKSHGLCPPIPTIQGQGEALVAQFGEGEFTGAYCANALDHCHSPLTVLHQMLAVVERGGVVKAICMNNVGEMEQYQGLHQWNITIRNGRPVIWRKDELTDIRRAFEGMASIEATIDEGEIVHLLFRKF